MNLRSDVLPVASLVPNAWNPNRVTPAVMAKIRASIERNGFVDPVTVWDDGGTNIIIDGEHRVEAAGGLGLAEVPCTVIWGITAAQAKELTITLNELRGQPDPAKLTELLRDLTDEPPLDELLKTLPFTEDLVRTMLGTPVDLPILEERKSTWTELSFRVPTEAAEVINAALAKVQEEEEMERWQALEAIAAEYLAS